MNKKVAIMGTRGIPASHGGFETFAEYLSLYLQERGWDVTVYCQINGTGKISYSEWNGCELVKVPVKGNGAFSSIIFDLKAIVHSLFNSGIILTLGYNSALLNVIHKVFGRTNIINMDGIEWKREKWGRIAKAWFWLNERIGCWCGSCLIADHPEIKVHLRMRSKTKTIEMIPYGGVEVLNANEAVLSEFDLIPDGYSLLIARPEPENSILEVVKAYSSKKRNKKLVVLGKYDINHPYQSEVLEAASNEIVFLGAIYDVDKVSALRYFSRFYVHGHTVGGTNPSLVESIATGSAILAHDNKFNRWVSKNGALYFADESEICSRIESLYGDDVLVGKLKDASLDNFNENFRWNKILSKYENVLTDWYPT